MQENKMSENLQAELPLPLIKQFSTQGLEKAENELVQMYGGRYIEYRRQWNLAGNFDYEPPFPLYIMMEQTYRCNMRCLSCIHAYPELQRKFSFDISCMPWNLYEKVILEGEKNNCPSISTHNNDEPLLVKDLEARIAFAKEHGFMDIIMTTNGIMFNEERIMGVINAGVTRILFSIDALTEETYDSVRVGGDFKKVLWALNKTIEYKKKLGTNLPIVRVSFAVNSLNRHELKQFIEEYSTIADYIDIQPYYTWKNANSKLIPEDADLVRDFRCNSPWRILIVRGNGDVLPCPNFYGVEVTVGNIYNESLRVIFASDIMKRMRRDFKNKIYRHPACFECSNGLYKIDMRKIQV